jgi:hypothetical protein
MDDATITMNNLTFIVAIVIINTLIVSAIAILTPEKQ